MVPVRPAARTALTVLSLLVATACNPFGGDDTPTTTQPPPTTPPAPQAGLSIDGKVILGAVLPLTGELARFGPGMQAAVELAVDEVNDAGGILGQDVELVVHDSQSTPEQAAAAARQLISGSNVDALIGPVSTLELVPMVLEPALTAERAMCSPAASSPLLTAMDDKGLLFTLSPNRIGIAPVLERLVHDRGPARVAIVSRDDGEISPLAAQLRRGFDPAFGAPGSDIVADVLVQPATPALAPGAASTTSSAPTGQGGTDTGPPRPLAADAAAPVVVEAGPTAVIALLAHTEAAPLFQGLFDAALLPSQGSPLAVLVGDTLASDELGSVVDPEKPGMLNGVEGVRPLVDPNRAKSFNDRLRAETAVRVTDLAAEAYECAVLMMLAAVGGDDPVAMAGRVAGLTNDGAPCAFVLACRDALTAGNDVDYDGSIGLGLNGDGDPALGLYEHFRFGDRGQMIPVDTWTVTLTDAGPEIAGGPLPPLPVVPGDAPDAQPDPLAPSGEGKTTTTLASPPAGTRPTTSSTAAPGATSTTSAAPTTSTSRP